MSKFVLKDPDIRVFLLEEFQKKGLWFREEMGVQGAVADVVVLYPDHLHVYEIKSDADTLSRLPSKVVNKRTRRGREYTTYQWGQVECYSRSADKVTLVVGTKLLDDAMGLIPSWWGVRLAEFDGQRVKFTDIRKASMNPDLKWHYVYQFLWRDECLEIAKSKSLKRVGSMSKSNIGRELKKVMSLDELRKEIRTRIPHRTWKKFRT